MKTKPNWPPFSHEISQGESGGDLPPLAPPATLECDLDGDAERLHETGGLAKWTPFTRVIASEGAGRVKLTRPRKWGPPGSHQSQRNQASEAPCHPSGGEVCGARCYRESWEVEAGWRGGFCGFLARQTSQS